MNAINFTTILPQQLIRQARVAFPAASARHEPERIVTFTAAPLTADLRATAINVREDLERRDLAPLLKLVVWIFQPMAARKGVTLRLDAPEIGLYAICQELRIQRVLESLLSNALRHSPARSTVTLAARVEEDRLCVWVEDQGPGVPLAEQSGLFENAEASFGEFIFGASEESRGLVSAKDIISAHGGEIFMYNRVEGGAHFEFRLLSQNGRRDYTGPGKGPTYTSSWRSGAVKVMPMFKTAA